MYYARPRKLLCQTNQVAVGGALSSTLTLKLTLKQAQTISYIYILTTLVNPNPNCLNPKSQSEGTVSTKTSDIPLRLVHLLYLIGLFHHVIEAS
jgi:hypothetical protein